MRPVTTNYKRTLIEAPGGYRQWGIQSLYFSTITMYHGIYQWYKDRSNPLPFCFLMKTKDKIDSFGGWRTIPSNSRFATLIYRLLGKNVIVASALIGALPGLCEHMIPPSPPSSYADHRGTSEACVTMPESSQKEAPAACSAIYLANLLWSPVICRTYRRVLQPHLFRVCISFAFTVSFGIYADMLFLYRRFIPGNY